MFVVTVQFRVKQEHHAAFLDAVVQNAATSLANEADCRVFDVCTDPHGSQTVFLYEVYVSAAAFDHHLQTPHFKEFDRLVTPWVADKQVDIWQRESQQ